MTDPEPTISERLDQLELFTGSEPRKIEMYVSSWIEALADAADADLLLLVSKLRSLGVSGEFVRHYFYLFMPRPFNEHARHVLRAGIAEQ